MRLSYLFSNPHIDDGPEFTKKFMEYYQNEAINRFDLQLDIINSFEDKHWGRCVENQAPFFMDPFINYT